MIGAGAGSLAAYLATWPGIGLAGSEILAAALGAGALAGFAFRRKRPLRALLGAALGAAGGLAFAWTVPLWPPFAALLLGGFSVPILAEGQPRRRKALTAILAGIAGAAGIYVARVLLGWDPLGGLVPGALGAAAAGGAAGLFVGLASAPKFLARPMDPVEQRLIAALHGYDDDLRDILDRSLLLYRGIRAETVAREDDPALAPVEKRVAQALFQILRVVRNVRGIERDMATIPAAELDDRIRDLEARAEKSIDPTAQATYREAIVALREQRSALETIAAGRDRIVARLHAHLAALEKLRFGLLHRKSAHAEKADDEASFALEALEDLGREIDATSSAMSQVFGARPLDTLTASAPTADAKALPAPGGSH